MRKRELGVNTRSDPRQTTKPQLQHMDTLVHRNSYNIEIGVHACGPSHACSSSDVPRTRKVPKSRVVQQAAGQLWHIFWN